MEGVLDGRRGIDIHSSLLLAVVAMSGIKPPKSDWVIQTSGEGGLEGRDGVDCCPLPCLLVPQVAVPVIEPQGGCSRGGPIPQAGIPCRPGTAATARMRPCASPPWGLLSLLLLLLRPSIVGLARSNAGAQGILKRPSLCP